MGEEKTKYCIRQTAEGTKIAYNDYYMAETGGCGMEKTQKIKTILIRIIFSLEKPFEMQE